MRALDRKLLRDLWSMRSMAAAIALVLVGGVSTFVMSLVTYDSLELTRALYYRNHSFAEVFASLVRAPEAVADRIRTIAGVNLVETRVVAGANLDIAGFADPVTARLVSLPEHGDPLLNIPYIKRGRTIAPRSGDEVLVSEEFAQAHGLIPGDRLAATIKGKRHSLRIVGIALSPEYMYAIPPGGFFPDHKRFAVLWMGREGLGSAYEMDGAFNDISLTLQKGARARDVIDRMDQVLNPYGGFGAYDRDDHFSHRFISEELSQLEVMATVFPVIFLGVAAFLLNIVVSRMVALERDQIATLKAFGYSTLDVGMHYTKLVLAITAAGIVAGIGLGFWFARGMGYVYASFYSFPWIRFVFDPTIVAAAVLVGGMAALVGTAMSVRKAAAVPPAEGMRPEPPASYSRSLLERLGFARNMSEPSRMIVRHITRQPRKTALTIAGIAASCGILMITNFQRDAVDFMIDVQYGKSQREDLTVLFTEATPRRALYSLRSLPGVGAAEGFRSVPALLRHRHYRYRTAINGVEPDGDLQRVLDENLERVQIPDEGVVLTDYLASQVLHIEPGQMLTIEVLEGRRPIIEVPVAGTTRQYLGVNAYMLRDTLNRLMHEGPAINGAYLTADASSRSALFSRFKQMPRVAGSVIRETAMQQFDEMMDESILFFAFITALLGGFIAFGVVYNSARIALSERGRELASLRVLGFTRGEVAYILLGELGLLTLLALPVGFAFGNLLSGYLAQAISSDLYRVPLVIEPATYALATLVIVASLALSSWPVWRELSRLDLNEVLKTRD